MEKMLVTQALNELKLLDGRIERAIESGSYVSAAKICEKKVSSGITKDAFCGSAKASLQSVRDLMERRKKIKSAVVESNANTMVTVNNVEMTRADAIERKKSIEYEKMLLATLRTQLSRANSVVTTKNTSMEAEIVKLAEAALGKDTKQKVDPDGYASIATPYRTSNEYGLVDPLNIAELISKLEEDIEGFLSNVDSVLQISNCTTYIEF